MSFQNVWVVSDTHFNHSRIIDFSSRPFVNTEEMDEALIENWNKVVKPNDLIFHLGDVFFCNAQRMKEISDRLNGRKILILGNHDIGRISKSKFRKLGFEPYMYYVFEELFLSHYPQQVNPLSSLVNNTDIIVNVHGHTHEQTSHLNKDIHYCVSVENINYTPIHVDQVFSDVARGKRPYDCI
ncbi:metallophosphoesterase [Alkalihalophilus pseudofirmus]|uniref:metallophosphoesterase n=1 Tax=Alkalihalophilus pseudofirmus TaxID=79885 RepID=UPI00259B8ADA|nr:metallophosphoesterase [Alkalihalophilus pseudofirmus]WEG18596.1 metallophosphoesterase [Alkalihalophilus pseudofirmus]